MPEGAHPECFGPYLRYAIWKEFANFVFFHQDHHSVFLLIELKKPGSMAEFADALKKSNLTVEFGPSEEHSRYVTMIADNAVVLDSSTFDAWNKYVDRVELSLPIRPGNREFASVKKLAERWDQGQTTPGTLVIGLLDDGCPFAAAQFLNVSATGAVSTRVRAIWDQNQGKQPIEIDKAGTKFCFGEKLTDFNYGLEYRRDSVGQQIGLDEWIQRYRTSTGSIEEQRCYSDGDFTRLASRVSHGAHVMDVFAGRIPTSSRIGDHRNPPSWAVANPNTDPACGVDLVFVQFPLSCIRDATGVWLKCYVVNGIRYILSCADPQTTKNVIVNLSYGPTTGPHDGTHDLETAIAELVAEYDGSGGKPKLEVVLAAGNSYLREEHVKFKNEHTGLQDIEWIWRLSADNSVLCFCEVWMEANEVDAAVTVTITPPGGAARVISSQPWGTSTMWLLNVGPTVVPAPLPYTASEPHGDYTIKVTGIRAGAEVHAYVARSDPNMGVVTGAKRSYFVDPNWVGTHSAAASCTYADGEFDRSGSRIHRDGTLNGIATAKVSSVHVAGGYIIANGRKSPYSSAGPARGGPRVGPDYLLPCDESYALKGIRAGGNRSGAVFRLVGTSVAAPELARQVVKLVSALPFPTPTNVPTSPGEIAKGGGGNIEPP